MQRLAPELIGERIKEERIKQGLTQANLAEKADLHNNYIGLIERAQCNISISTLEKLSKAFGLKNEDLIK